MDATAYCRQLKLLLPRGRVWVLDEGAELPNLLLAISDELARVDGRAAQLLRERDPRTADETLEDWEKVLAVVPAEGATDAGRRLAIAAKLIATGGQTAAYYLAVALALGFAATVAVTDDYVWTMTVDLGASTSPFPLRVQTFRSGASRSGDRLRSWTIPELETEINRLKPAHTRALFVYQE
jgi:uncharacterized protein YmfQ (DUF2313 family)